MSNNTFIRTLASPGLSLITMSFFRASLTLKFVPCIGEDHNGLHRYCKITYLSTTINYDGAALLYAAVMRIIKNGESEEQIEAVLPCGNNTTLTLEYRPDDNNKMAASLIINKNNMTIPFKFSTSQITIFEDRRPVPRVVQSGLGVFVSILKGYLSGIGANNHLNKFTEEELEAFQTT